MCKTCSANAVGKTRRKGRRSRVSGFKIQPVKGLLNLPTLGAAGATAYGAGKMATDATGTEYAMLRSKQGAKQLAIAGTAGALLIPGNGLLSKIGRGVALGLMVHGVAVIATDKDLAGNDVTFETNAEVKGVYWPNNYDAYAGNGGGNGGARSRARI